MDVHHHGPADGGPAGENPRPPTEVDPSTTASAPSGAGAALGASPSPEPEFSMLSPKVLLLWRWAWAAVGATVIVLSVIAAAAAVDAPAMVRIVVPVLIAVVAVAVVVLVPSAAYARWHYRVTDDGLDLQHGLVVRQQSSIPHFRVQHVDVRRGLIQRQLGIVSLTISTASPATDAQLPGLDPERAEAIRRRVLDRAEADDGV